MIFFFFLSSSPPSPSRFRPSFLMISWATSKSLLWMMRRRLRKRTIGRMRMRSTERDFPTQRSRGVPLARQRISNDHWSSSKFLAKFSVSSGTTDDYYYYSYYFSYNYEVYLSLEIKRTYVNANTLGHSWGRVPRIWTTKRIFPPRRICCSKYTHVVNNYSLK